MWRIVPVALICLVAAGCPQPIPSVDGVEVELSSSSFQTEVLESDVPVLVDFNATWCKPCREMEPVVAQLSLDYQGRLKVAKLDVDDAGALAAQYGVSGIPAFILFVDGQEVDRTVGGQSLAELASFVEPHVAPPAAAPVPTPTAEVSEG